VRRTRTRWFFPVLVALCVVVAVSLIGPGRPVRPLIALEPVVTEGLDQPVGLAGDPSDSDALYVLEREGRIRFVFHGEVMPDPVLDLTDDVLSDGAEQGLLGIALHPGFADNRRAFIWYTDVRERHVLEEVRLSEDGRAAIDGSRRDVLTIPDPAPDHNGGQLAFGPDGMLYVGVGDGGLMDDGWRDGRDPASLLGKILRLDVDAEAGPGGPAYVVPPDNPFLDDPEARPEVWALGLRNPWRFAFDEESENLWIGDVGQLKWEEVSVIPWREGGANFGWNMYEGRQCFERPSCDPAGITMPLVTYAHTFGNCAVVGGPVYRGPEGRLNGQYLLGDYCSGRIWTIGPGDEELTQQLDTDLAITSFGEGSDGNVYVTAQGGQLLRVISAE
jgi:glucose/arabinose dehydrogenase